MMNRKLIHKPSVNECDFCSRNQEWEDAQNGFFMELRLDVPYHGIHINLGYDTPREKDLEFDFNYCPMCGRKLVEDDG